MKSTTIRPPNVFGLHSHLAHDPLLMRSRIPQTSLFAQFGEMLPFPAGFKYENCQHQDKDGKPDWSYSIVFRANEADAAEVADWVARGRAFAAPFVEKRKAEFAEREAIRKRADRERRLEFRKICSPMFPSEVAAVIKQAQAMLDEWGKATHRGDRVRDIIGERDIMLHGEVRELRDLMLENSRLQKKRRRKAEAAAPTDLPCPDEVIAHAIRTLTVLDDDHSTEANREGWGRSTTHTGHWCNRMLNLDRELAIKEGRRLITMGKHQAQLARLGIKVAA